jgi:hypothetical protein
MYELLYETKAIGKEQYHNNFGCYGFIACPNASHPVPTFWKRWPGAWMEEWFYVKNDLKAKEDIKEVIMRPIWSRFGLRRQKMEIDDTIEACQRAFSTVCSFIGTRDLIQEHIAFRVWLLVESWEMPKETTTDSSEGGLVRLKYTFRFREKFDETNDDWLKCIEATSDELLGAYSKAEDNALSTAFGGRGKKRLNRVFDAIGFVYPDYRYPLRGQEKKRKIAASATPTEHVLKSKKVKVLTHRPRYIEPVVVPEFGAGSTPAAEATQSASITQSAEEPTTMPKTHTVKAVEDKIDAAEGLKAEKMMQVPKILSPLTEATLPKVQKASVATPKSRRMTNVLDAMLETTKALSPAPAKKVAQTEAKSQAKAETGQTETEATQAQADAEAGPSVPTEMEPTDPKGKTTDQIASEKIEVSALEASNKSIGYIIRHASEKRTIPRKNARSTTLRPKIEISEGGVSVQW